MLALQKHMITSYNIYSLCSLIWWQRYVCFILGRSISEECRCCFKNPQNSPNPKLVMWTEIIFFVWLLYGIRLKHSKPFQTPLAFVVLLLWWVGVHWSGFLIHCINTVQYSRKYDPLTYIRMKILNDTACKLNWIGFKFNSIEFKYIVEWNSNTTKFNSDWNELRFNEKKTWDANWWRKYWDFVCEYGVEKKSWKKT